MSESLSNGAPFPRADKRTSGERWQNALPAPVAFVLSGGASLGAIQVGMLRALADIGLAPDLIVGVSVGALNAGAIAGHGLWRGVEVLEEIWTPLTRQDIFPGGLFSQTRQFVKTRLSLFPPDGIAAVIARALPVAHFEQLALPLGVVATELSTHQRRLFEHGELAPALLASTAIPGIFPPVKINATRYVDGGLVATVPIRAALDMGANSIVVLDAGSTCAPEPPRHIADLLISTLHAAFRQRVRAEAPMIADIRPVLYLSSPCPITRSPYDFRGTPALIEAAAQTARDFLEHCPIPRRGEMCGGPHFHHADEQLAIASRG